MVGNELNTQSVWQCSYRAHRLPALPASLQEIARRSISAAGLPDAIERQAAAAVDEADALVLVVDGQVRGCWLPSAAACCCLLPLCAGQGRCPVADQVGRSLLLPAGFAPGCALAGDCRRNVPGCRRSLLAASRGCSLIADI